MGVINIVIIRWDVADGLIKAPWFNVKTSELNILVQGAELEILTSC